MENLNDPIKGSKVTSEQFVANIKNKYPQYKNIEDGELLTKILKKYPQYRNNIEDKKQEQPKKVTAEQNGVSSSASANTPSSSVSSNNLNGWDKVGMQKGGVRNKPKTNTQPSQVDIERIKKEATPRLSELPISDKQKKNIADKAVSDVKYTDLSKAGAMTDSEYQRKIADNYQITKDSAPIEEYLNNNAEYKDNIILNDSDGNFVDLPSENQFSKNIDKNTVAKVESIIPNISELGVNPEDLSGFIKNNTSLIKGVENGSLKWDRDKQLEIDRVLQEYMHTKATSLVNRRNALINRSKIDGVDRDTEIQNLTTQIEGVGANYENYKAKNLPVLTEENKKRIELNKAKYESLKNNRVKSTLFGLGELAQDGWNVIEKSGQDLFATIADNISEGAGDRIRATQSYNNWKNQSIVGHNVSVSGKEVELNGTKYVVSSNGEIYDKDAEVLVNDFLSKDDLNNIDNLAKTSKKSTHFFNDKAMLKHIVEGGTFGVTVALANKGLGGVGVSEKIAPLVSMSTIMGSGSYNDTVSELKRRGVTERDARIQGTKAGVVNAILGATLGQILELPLMKSGLTKDINQTIAKEVTNAYIKGGDKAVTSYLSNDVVNSIVSKVGQATKGGYHFSAFVGAQTMVNDYINGNINESLKKDVLQTGITPEQLLEQMATSFVAGGVLGLGQGSPKLKDYQKLEYLSKNYDMFVKTNDANVKNGVITRAEADKTLELVENFKKFSNKIPKDVSPEKVVDLLDVLNQRDILETEKKNSDKAFHPEIDAKLKDLDIKINEIKNRDESTKETTTETISEPNKEIEGRTEESNIGETKETSNEVKQPSEKETINDFEGTPVKYTTYEGKEVEGVLKRDGQRVVVEEGDKIHDVGNVEEIGNNKLSDHSMRVSKPVEIKENGDIQVRGERYKTDPNRKTSEHVNRNENGEITSVTLYDSKGNKKKFKGQEAEDIAYQIHLSGFENQIKDSVDKANNPKQESSSVKEVSEPKGVIDKFIDNVDGLIAHIDKHTKGTLGVSPAPVIAKGALKIVRETAVATKNTIKAIEAGIDYIKKSDWYKNLSAKEKLEYDKLSVEKQFNDLIEASKNKEESNAEKRVETLNVDKKQSTKKTIKENTGQTDKSKEVKTTEAKLLKEKFARLQQGAKIGFKEGVKVTKETAKNVSDNLATLKKDFAEYINDNTKGIGKHLTQREKERLLNMVAKINEKNIVNITNAVDNIVNRLEGRKDKANYKELKSLQDKALKSLKTFYDSSYNNIRNLVRIDPLFIPSEKLESYHEMMRKLSKKEPVKSSEVDSMFESLKNDIVDFNKTKLETSQPKEVKQETIDKNLDSVKLSRDTVDKKYKKGELKINKDGKRIVDEFLEIPVEFLEKNLDSSEISSLKKALNHLAETGELSKTTLSDITAKYKGDVIAESIKQDVGSETIKAVGTLSTKLRALFRNDSSKEDFDVGIENTMLQHIDSVFTKIKSMTVYKNFIHPITSSYSLSEKVTSDASQELLHTFSKARGKMNDFESNVFFQLFFRQREFESNPLLHNKKVFDVRSHVDATLNKNDSKYNTKDKETINNVFTKMEGKSYKEIYDKMSDSQKDFVKIVDKYLKSYEDKLDFYDNHVSGKGAEKINNYFPKNNEKKGSKNESLELNSNGSISLTAGYSKDRINNKADALNFNTINTLLDYINRINTEYYVGQKVKEVNTALKKLESVSDNKSLSLMTASIKSSVNKFLETRSNNSLSATQTKTARFVKTLARNTYNSVLVDFFVRLPKDAISGYIPTYLFNADRLGKMRRANKELSTEVLDKMFETITSTQVERVLSRKGKGLLGTNLGVHSVDYRSTNTHKTSQRKYDTAKPRFLDKSVDMFAHNQLSDLGNEFSKVYYEVADLPARHLFKMHVVDFYEKISKEKFNGDKYLKDSEYSTKVDKILKENIATIDKLTSDVFNTSATSERKIKYLSDPTNLITSIDSFLGSFRFNEFKTFWDSAKGTTGIGKTSYENLKDINIMGHKVSSEAMRTFGIVNARGLMYSYLGGMIGKFIVNLFVEDKEEIKMIDEEAGKKSLAQHLALISAGNAGNIANLAVSIGVELINRQMVNEYGDEEYNPFKDNLLYAPNEYSKPQDLLALGGAEGNAAKVIVDSGLLIGKMWDKVYNEKEELTFQDLVDLRATPIILNLVSQVTGLPIRYFGNNAQKVLSSEYPKETTKNKTKTSSSMKSNFSSGFNSNFKSNF